MSGFYSHPQSAVLLSASGQTRAARLPPLSRASVPPQRPEYPYGASYQFADLDVAELDEMKQRELAAWLHVRFEMNCGALNRKLGRPRSTVYGWLKQFQRKPTKYREAVIQELDEQFLR